MTTYMHTKNNTEYILKMLKKYAYHSQSYNILKKDKLYFYSPSGIDGVIAYVVYANVAIVAGDPICDISDFHEFISEYKNFCKKQKWQCCFQSITKRCKNIIEKMDFSLIKIGEEPIFDLNKFSLEGSKFRGLRKNINSAKKHGLTVIEYNPLLKRCPKWEKEMEELSIAWKKIKGSKEFSFLIGTPSIANPGERKYFLVLLNNKVESFVTCTPIYSRNGIYFDAMRRKKKTINGTNQLLFTESFRILKKQGYVLATLGTAPLSYKHVNDPNQSRMIKLALKLTFEHLKYFHRYKPLYQFKKQFGPSSWEANYLAFSPRFFNPVILYALLKAYDPTNVTKKLLRELNFRWEKIKKLNKNKII